MFHGTKLKPNYKVYCPSYKRHNLATTHLLFKPETFCYVVGESEVEAYKKLGVDVKSIPEEKNTCIAAARNWILENRDQQNLVQVDDDMKAIYWILRRERIPLSPDDIHHQIVNGFQMSKDLGAGLWGMQVNPDPMTYSTKYPFLLNKPVCGTFCGISDIELRYDETITLKEDYDYFIQSMLKYRKVLRFEFLCYYVDHQKMAGGCQEYRTHEKELENKIKFKKKWGDKIIRDNERNPDSYNLRIRLPI